MKVLAIGDVFGRPGRQALAVVLPKLIEQYAVDLVVVNAENAAGGRGLTPDTAKELLDAGAQVLTGGNHIWEQQSLYASFSDLPLARPYNTRDVAPGRGFIITNVGDARVAVMSLQGLIFMSEKGLPMRNPFTAADEALAALKNLADIVLVDFHAEATSEKRAMAWHVDGRAAALWGTHTHVQTADEHIMPQGLAYITDLGMTGPHASVVGLDKDAGLARIMRGEKVKFKVAEEGVQVQGALIEISDATGKAVSIERVQRAICM